MITLLFSLFSVFDLSEDSVRIVRHSQVDALVGKHIEYNKTAPVNGFRINIYSQSGNHSRGAALLAQTAFEETFPSLKSYVSFEEPNFNVTVGNFRTRIEASDALEHLKYTYPHAYVVRDVLNVKDLLGIITVEEKEETDEEEEDDDEL